LFIYSICKPKIKQIAENAPGRFIDIIKKPPGRRPFAVGFGAIIYYTL